MRQNNNTNPKWEVSILLLLLIGLPVTLFGQSVINASGGSHMFSGGVYEYSIGEMTLISTEIGSDIIVTQGLLQIEDVSLGVEDQSILIQGLSVYPNPTKNTVFIKPSMGKSGTLSLKLFDLLGRPVLEKKSFLETGQEEQQLDLSLLSDATYMLHVEFLRENRRYHNSYKILKYSGR